MIAIKLNVAKFCLKALHRDFDVDLDMVIEVGNALFKLQCQNRYCAYIKATTVEHIIKGFGGFGDGEIFPEHLELCSKLYNYNKKQSNNYYIMMNDYSNNHVVSIKWCRYLFQTNQFRSVVKSKFNLYDVGLKFVKTFLEKGGIIGPMSIDDAQSLILYMNDNITFASVNRPIPIIINQKEITDDMVTIDDFIKGYSE